MPVPTLINPTGRKTDAHIFTDAEGNEFFFSYQTCIAYRGDAPDSPTPGDGGVAIRVANAWGPTTGRHFKELGCSHFQVMDSENFIAMLEGDDSAWE